jgi:small subunit ribosomal protein S16
LKEEFVAVRIRLKKMGRRHRPFFRICAMDVRVPVNGRVLEELGTYDPMVPETDARAVMNHERVQHWLGVGALPSDKCAVLIKKYGPNGTHLDKQRTALERLAQSHRRPEPLMSAARPQETTAVAEAGREAAQEIPVDAETGNAEAAASQERDQDQADRAEAAPQAE